MAKAKSNGQRTVARIRGAFEGKQHALRRRWALGSAIGAGALVAGALGVNAWRRRQQAPNLQEDASATAMSVRNAAKGVVINALRESEPHGDAALSQLRAVSATTVTEAASVGADITAAAVGAVEGALSVARMVDLDPHDAGSAAREGALEASRDLSEAAARRVRAALRSHLGSLPEPSPRDVPLRSVVASR